MPRRHHAWTISGVYSYETLRNKKKLFVNQTGIVSKTSQLKSLRGPDLTEVRHIEKTYKCVILILHLVVETWLNLLIDLVT